MTADIILDTVLWIGFASSVIDIIAVAGLITIHSLWNEELSYPFLASLVGIALAFLTAATGELTAIRVFAITVMTAGPFLHIYLAGREPPQIARA